MGDETRQEKPQEQKLQRIEEGMVPPRVVVSDVKRGMVPPKAIKPDATKGMVPPKVIPKQQQPMLGKPEKPKRK